MSSGYAAAPSFGQMEHLTWSRGEKVVARKAFDQALQRELRDVIAEAKKRAERIKAPTDVWDLESYLIRRHAEIDVDFDYRYSVLIIVFGNLIRRGRLREEELHGLSEDKLDAIRRFASP